MITIPMNIRPTFDPLDVDLLNAWLPKGFSVMSREAVTMAFDGVITLTIGYTPPGNKGPSSLYDAQTEPTNRGTMMTRAEFQNQFGVNAPMGA